MVHMAEANPLVAPLVLGRLPVGRVELLDTTLRDGLHGLGVYFSDAVKARIARKLLDLGVDFVEAGFPQACPEDVAFFRSFSTERTVRDRLIPLGLKSKKDLPARQDMGLNAMLSCETPVVALVGKTSAAGAKSILKLDPDENLDQIEESVAYLVRAGRGVVFLAEGFLDAYRVDPSYALRVLDRAVAGGARRVVVCDTSGGAMPEQVRDAVAAVVARFGAGVAVPIGRGRPVDPADVVVGFHGHNDCGVGVANALAAVAAGAGHVQGTVNGLGGRCGNVDLVVTALNLGLKYDRDVLAPGSRERLKEVSRLVADTLNMPYRSDQPYVGSNAFADKAGLHVAANLLDPTRPYEHVAPETVGNRSRVVVSSQSGRKAVQTKFKEFGLLLPEETAQAVLDEVKQLEKTKGYQFDDAQASVYLLGLRHLGRYDPWFTVQSYSVVVKHTPTSKPEEEVEATVRLTVGGEPVHTAATGTGPLNALDRALRKALEPTHPGLKRVKLFDYMVRVINEPPDSDGRVRETAEPEGTAARVRVTLKTRRWDHDRKDYQEWGTCGVSTNLVEATWTALMDALYFWQLLEARCVVEKHFDGLVRRVVADE